ncbi:substrate-binding domain-containing protein [Microbacterium keratanolyticum]
MGSKMNRMRVVALATAGLLGLAALSGCSSSGNSGDGASGAPSNGDVGVTLIVKTTSNSFFTSMEDGAKTAAEKLGVNLTLAAGKDNGDEAGQITAIENAISRGDAGILITPSGPGVEDALVKARDAGLYVIALDTPPANSDSVDITFATDNFLAGQLIGQWTAAKLNGEKAVIALLDAYDDRIVATDLLRDQGFLDGMGIDIADKGKMGDEEPTGKYSGGDYEIVGNAASQAAEDGGRTAMETLLSANPDINVAYAINEPAAYGAEQAIEAAGKSDQIMLVTVDGGCQGVGEVSEGNIAADSQQYPVKMAELGVQAIYDLITKGEKPEVTEGLDFFNTGVALVTDDPQDGIDSITSDEASDICWG